MWVFLLLGMNLALPWRACSADLELKDLFADRMLATSESGSLTGSNIGAGVESGEPRHGGKVGNHTVWISWTATRDGIATFSTLGSTFDTLMSVYSFRLPSDTTLDKLREDGRNDDDPDHPPTSLVQIGALAGVRYEIGISGLGDAAGAIHLQWSFLAADDPPPIILDFPADQSAREGDPVRLSVVLDHPQKVKFEWRLNGNSLNVDQSELFIPSLQKSDLGLYTIRIRVGNVRFETAPIELQINSEGQTNALARDKLLDSLSSSLELTDDHGGQRLRLAEGGAPTRGYNGTQIFNTTYASTDPSEPTHCGLTGGSSYWFMYQPPEDSTVTLDTLGSTYDTILAVYNFVPPLGSYQDLTLIACDQGSLGVVGGSRIEFAALKGRYYAVVVDGLNGARGVASLNYKVDITRPPVAPRVTPPTDPTIQALAGEPLKLEFQALGSPPLHFHWMRSNVVLPDQTNQVLTLPSLGPGDEGVYQVKINSHIGETVSPPVELKLLLETPQLKVFRVDDQLVVECPKVANQTLILETATVLEGPWTLVETVAGSNTFTNSIVGIAQFFRLRAANSTGP